MIPRSQLISFNVVFFAFKSEIDYSHPKIMIEANICFLLDNNTMNRCSKCVISDYSPAYSLSRRRMLRFLAKLVVTNSEMEAAGKREHTCSVIGEGFGIKDSKFFLQAFLNGTSYGTDVSQY